MDSAIGLALCLLGMLLAGSVSAQAPAPIRPEKASAVQPAKAPAKTEAGTASGKLEPAPKAASEPQAAKPVPKAGKPALQPAAKTTASGKPKIAPRKATKPRAAAKSAAKAKPGKPAPKRAAKKTPVKKPEIKPNKASKRRVVSKPSGSSKAKPKRAKRRGKTTPGKTAPVKKPEPAAGPDVSMVLPATPLPEPKPPRPLLGEREAEARFREGEELEQRGKMQAALTAYREAGESGHGPAQKKMGDFYGTGNAVVERDYETALRWYDRARKQGINVPEPFTYPGVRR